MKIKPQIFRDYDIRGVYPTDLNEEVSYVIGRAFGSMVKRRMGKSIVVGRDNRKSSLFLTQSYIKGLLSTGINVTHIGITATPVIHFLTCGSAFDAGTEVTASHNPEEFNGFRLDYAGAEPVYGADIKKLLNMIEKEDFDTGSGDYDEEDLTKKYIGFLIEKFKAKRKLKVVLDCGNGTASELAQQVFQGMGYEVVPLYCEYNSKFPHGIPDPENPLFLKSLEKQVLENKADVGFGFDTDADRFGVVDEKGVSYSTDEILMLVAADLLHRNPHEKIVYDVKGSGEIDNFIKSRHGIPVMTRTGHPYVFEEVKNGGSVGAEYSGHMFFADRYYGYDDGIYSACRIAEIISNQPKTLSELLKIVPRQFSTPEVKVPVRDEDKFRLVKSLSEKVKNDEDVENYIELDGIRANISPTAWFLIRASNTTPNISVRLGGSSEREKAALINKVEQLFKGFDIKINFDL
ncbi:hypothetical protein A3K34_02850 [candidate division WWE3 bacterium RIFOXYC1_FULL_40_10]|uniref:Rhodanese domain-containing protein n=1 Tax=candidate division WWE3 bacterium RIFOXYA2_FULL_46_9 TaxID=1802636 RepID=A0A1F4W065_UNCKA|nr:MAG: hypothetical protein A3K58_02850 [candidate division WWE3 bacterium RIFOXYB1_FULL_40_22]OGC61785.1 MAG: hypothetical protein A3K37_02850 [candidate division WWE3 bacterium RIFOXYA1_FULL_40_11]OGC62804.1 MAG: hypothetical protein A2264_04010 [candidate division WWE3 bacterium RIFOXYA2_FULL_46_9]OGC65166.1 MAG: hypothetical protein A2326_02300 [candidate division WWE3 bacterium RIFOXYB2_FULL_41_6]OGC66168.1 MAG: hypothetical protein A3K34_02850 [candidate division WWE3 bacterium RIFOXYC1_